MADRSYLGAIATQELVKNTQLLDVNEQAAVIDSLAAYSQYAGFGINTVATAAYAFTAIDSGRYLRHTFNGAKTAVVNADATVGALDTGSRIKGRVANTGSITFSAGGGATLNAPGGTLVVPANATYDLIKVGPNAWDLSWSA